MKKILIVDDNIDLSEMLAYSLKLQDYDVSLAHDGIEGLKQADLLKPNLIVLDVNMPLLDGVSFVRQLRSQPTNKDIPLVIVTGNDFLQKQFMEEGEYHFFCKPFELNDVVTRISDILED